MYGLEAYSTLVHAVCWVRLTNGSATPTSLRETHNRIMGLDLDQRLMLHEHLQVKAEVTWLRRRVEMQAHGIVVQPLHSMM